MESVAPWAEPVLMTAEELLRLPEDEWRYELVEGRLVRMSPTGGAYSQVVVELMLAMGQYVRERQLGVMVAPETGFWISAEGAPDTVLAPDLAFVRRGREVEVRVPGYLRLAPDLVVEVVSPSQTRTEMRAKARRWLEAGVQLVWIILPELERVEVWRQEELDRVLTRDDELSGEDVVPGFSLPIEQLFS